MYYDSYKRRDRRYREDRRGGGCMGWLTAALFKLLALALVLAILAAALLYALPVGLMNVEPAGMDLSPTDGLPGGRVNVLLLGLDALSETGQRSDAILVASVGRDGVRLTSLMRDTVVDIPGHGRQKLNAAFSIGGPELAMRVINQTFQLDVTNYVAADFRAMVELVDALGGVEVEVDAGELQYLNRYAYKTFKTLMELDPQRYVRFANSTPVAATGIMRLNGLFATGYSRIRYSDSDYVRTSRQRELLTAMLARLRERCWNPLVYLRLYCALRDCIQTNLLLPELISIGEKLLISGKVETFRLPLEEYLYDNGSTIEITDLDATVRALHKFIYAE